MAFYRGPGNPDVVKDPEEHFAINASLRGQSFNWLGNLGAVPGVASQTFTPNVAPIDLADFTYMYSYAVAGWSPPLVGLNSYSGTITFEIFFNGSFVSVLTSAMAWSMTEANFSIESHLARTPFASRSLHDVNGNLNQFTFSVDLNTTDALPPVTVNANMFLLRSQ